MSADKQAVSKETAERGAAESSAAKVRPQAAQAVKKPPEPSRKTPAPKSSSGALAGFSVFILMLILMIGAGAAIYFNIGGVKPAVANALGLYGEVEQESDELDERVAAIAAKETELAELQLQLEQAQAQLDQDRAALDQEKTDFEKQQAEMTGAQADAEKTAQTLAEMDPAKAAEIISVLGDSDEAVLILQSIAPEAAAKIMENMDPTLAAQLLSKVLVN